MNRSRDAFRQGDFELGGLCEVRSDIQASLVRSSDDSAQFGGSEGRPRFRPVVHEPFFDRDLDEVHSVVGEGTDHPSRLGFRVHCDRRRKPGPTHERIASGSRENGSGRQDPRPRHRGPEGQCRAMGRHVDECRHPGFEPGPKVQAAPLAMLQPIQHVNVAVDQPRHDRAALEIEDLVDLRERFRRQVIAARDGLDSLAPDQDDPIVEGASEAVEDHCVHESEGAAGKISASDLPAPSHTLHDMIDPRSIGRDPGVALDHAVHAFPLPPLSVLPATDTRQLQAPVTLDESRTTTVSRTRDALQVDGERRCVESKAQPARADIVDDVGGSAPSPVRALRQTGFAGARHSPAEEPHGPSRLAAVAMHRHRLDRRHGRFDPHQGDIVRHVGQRRCPTRMKSSLHESMLVAVDLHQEAGRQVLRDVGRCQDPVLCDQSSGARTQRDDPGRFGSHLEVAAVTDVVSSNDGVTRRPHREEATDHRPEENETWGTALRAPLPTSRRSHRRDLRRR